MLLPLLPSPPQPPPPTVKRLTPDELTSRRERGLCFNCDERYHRGHCCTSRVFLLIVEDEDPSWPHIDPFDPTQDTNSTSNPNPAQISLTSLSGNLAPETLRLTGFLSDHRMILLVDGRSTHNFIQPQLATALSLPCRTTQTPLRVMAGNGQYLECTSLCESVSLTIQNHVFVLDLHVLPISSANIVLGVQWLKTLGLVLTDYATLCMQFFHQGRLVELQGENDTNLGILTNPSFVASIGNTTMFPTSILLYFLKILLTHFPSTHLT